MKDFDELTVLELRKLPTLCTGQADDLKIDTGKMRVWLARCGPADGYYGPKIMVEHLRDGRWELCDDR